ncbi:MAG: DUF3810 domain-containing protein [Lachnospiraceae bacterium]|nr:DUF3810 domain-containing protein [Lachnospiraceae bacterium]MBQ6857176.1 DUF3810 domain-containing protein [Lachnospiraceae bacterium]
MIIWEDSQELFAKGKKKVIKGKCMKKTWIITAALFIAAIALLAASRIIPGFSEWYVQTIYPIIVGTIGRVMGWFLFSVVEFGLYAACLWIVWTLFRWIRRPMKIVRRYALFVSGVLFLYAACCGVNYYRTPFSYYYMMQKVNAGVPKTKEQEKEIDEILKELCTWLTIKVNEARVDLDAGENMYGDLQTKGVMAMNRLAEQYPALSGYYPKAKPVMISDILSIQQCSGVYSPFTVEANYNRDMVSYNIPHTICHEMSHLRGFMREDEANFIGYLACLGAEDADYRYSGYLLGWIYAGNALAKLDYEQYVENYSMLSDPVIADLEANHDFWEQYEGQVANVQETVNDAYLKANGQAEGVRTYGRVVDLMILDFQYRK